MCEKIIILAIFFLFLCYKLNNAIKKWQQTSKKNNLEVNRR